MMKPRSFKSETNTSSNSFYIYCTSLSVDSCGVNCVHKATFFFFFFFFCIQIFCYHSFTRVPNLFYFFLYQSALAIAIGGGGGWENTRGHGPRIHPFPQTCLSYYFFCFVLDSSAPPFLV